MDYIATVDTDSYQSTKVSLVGLARLKTKQNIFSLPLLAVLRILDSRVTSKCVVKSALSFKVAHGKSALVPFPVHA